MTTDPSGQALWTVTVGADFNLYYRGATNGDLTSSKSWASWGGSSRIRGEPFVLHMVSGGLEVFTVNAGNGHLMCKWSGYDSPSNADAAWFDLGGVLAGSPVAVKYDIAQSRYYVFGVGMNGAMYGCYYSGKWNWSSLGGNDDRVPAFQPEKIYASTDGNRRIDIVAVAVTNDLYHKCFNGSVWSAWVAIGKNAVGSRPLCWTTSKSRCDVVVKDAGDMKLYHTATDGCVPLGWQKVGDDTVTFDPAGCYYLPNSNRIDVAVISINGEMLHTWCTLADGKLGTWRNGYEKDGGCFSSSPKINVRKNGMVDLLGRGMNSQIFYKYWDNSKFIGWAGLGGVHMSKPA